MPNDTTTTHTPLTPQDLRVGDRWRRNGLEFELVRKDPVGGWMAKWPSGTVTVTRTIGAYGDVYLGNVNDEKRPSIINNRAVAELVLRLGEVHRATRHPDGVTPESDTTHTVMLALIACNTAPEGFNRDRIAILAQVHDLHEALDGDVDTTLGLSDAAKAAKDAKERETIQRIRPMLSPYLQAAMDEYHGQVTAEARWVYVIDKALPKLTQALNACAAPIASGISREALQQAHMEQLQKILGKDYDVRAVGILLDAMLDAQAAWPEPPVAAPAPEPPPVALDADDARINPRVLDRWQTDEDNAYEITRISERTGQNPLYRIVWLDRRTDGAWIADPARVSVWSKSCIGESGERLIVRGPAV